MCQCVFANGNLKHRFLFYHDSRFFPDADYISCGNTVATCTGECENKFYGGANKKKCEALPEATALVLCAVSDAPFILEITRLVWTE